MKFSNIALLSTIFGIVYGESCGKNKQCPKDKPCCSLYGECGTGSFCLGPCSPRYSYNLTSCAPAPICKTNDHEFTSLDRIEQNTKYLGDAESTDFVANNEVLSYGDSVLLTMANGSTGTVLTSTRAVWYGKVKVTLKSSRTQGVVTSFILMSGVRDEIDYEFIGSDLEAAQTNYYWQEVLDYTHARNVSLSDTFDNFHTYEFDWKEDSVTWSIDGQVGRVLKKDDTYNATSDSYSFPQTPSFIQVSLWPGGLASNPEDTRNWAGGNVNWNADDIKDPGYFYATLKDISVECYDPPSGTKKSGSKSYKYKNTSGLEGDIEITDDNTVMGSFEAVGFDMRKGSDDNLGSVAGSVPTGVGAGNNHAGSNTGDVPNASAVSVSSSKSSSSIGDVSAVSSSKQASGSSSTSSSSQAKSSSARSSSSARASSTSSAVGGFQQAGAATTSGNSSNGGSKMRVGMGLFGLLACSAGVLLF